MFIAHQYCFNFSDEFLDCALSMSRNLAQTTNTFINL